MMSDLEFVMILIALLVMISINLAVADAGRVSAVIVFGDSTVDPGNNNLIKTMLKSNFMPYGRDFSGGKPTGRFSNALLATDYISQQLGLKSLIPAYLDPAYNIGDFATGVSFASAGTGYDNATSDVLNVIPFWKEVEFFKEYQQRLREFQGSDKARETITDAIYIISIGTNDFLENYYTIPERSVHMTVEQFEDFLVDAATDFFHKIYELGARKLSLTGLGPIGCLPLERTLAAGGCIEKYNKVAMEFNVKMEALVQRLNQELPGLRMVFTDTYGLLLDVVQKPSRYGFEVSAKGCCSTGMFEMGFLCNKYNPCTCTDANKYVFWDAFHPSDRTNRLFADYIVKKYLLTLV